ncbi:MAG: PP2C family protein-serine/threonine phosphatase [Cyanobacteriota bacterium]|nr:PP2C family protein-serine/threonine phosphatase [Cyanobacteriota bacterium]
MGSLSIFRPAIRFLNHLKYLQKFSVISLLFLLPVTLFVYLLISEINSRIHFSQMEIYGTTYLRPISQLLEQIGQNRIELYQVPNPDQRLLDLKRLEEQLRAIATVDQSLNSVLDIQDELVKLDQNRQNLLESSLSPVTYDYLYQELTDQTHRLIRKVGDVSNLILDPDLDTYYLMDALLIKIPDMQILLQDIHSLAEEAIAQNFVSLEERSRLISLAVLLERYRHELDQAINVAFAQNIRKTIDLSLRSEAASFSDQSQKLSSEILLLINPLNQPDAHLYAQLSQEILGESFAFWQQTTNEMDQLLQLRILGFQQRKWFVFIFLSIILLLVTYLFIAFYLSVTQTVAALDVASKQMVEENYQGNLNLENQDELGQVVRSFNLIATNLANAYQQIHSLNRSLEAENARLSTELEVTRKIQQLILPRDEELNQIPDLEIAGFMESATEVGGDYYDVIRQGERLKIGIGDVTGHGLESGVLMIMVQMAVRTLLASDEKDPKQFLNAVNQAIYGNVQRMQSDKNLTLSLLDYQKGLLQLTGQHEEMILVRADGNTERIDTIDLGFPVGLEPEIIDFIDHREVFLYQGDIVVLYTDGITEAENLNHQQYGLERLCEVIRHHRYQSAQGIRKAIVEDLRQHIGQQKVFDDITLLVLKQK